MTATELIKKYDITLHTTEGQIKVPSGNKLPEKTKALIRAMKPKIIEELNGQKKAREEAKLAKLAEQEVERLAIISGAVTMQVKYHDGEHLAGWEVFGPTAYILTQLGIAKEISDWGCHVDNKAIEILGQEFTYQQVMDYMKPGIEAKLEAAKVKAEARQTKFDEARETGKPVLLRSWSTGCCDPREECSLDNHYEYAGWNH